MAAIEVGGREFSLREKMPPAVVLKWQRAQGDPNLSDADKAARVLDLLRGAVVKADWPAFEVAIDDIEDEQELFDLVKRVMESFSGRPTSRPSDSSDGPTSTPQNSESRPVVAVIRPDLALAASRGTRTA